MRRRPGEAPHFLIALNHVGDAVGDGKRRRRLHVLVEMAGVRRENHPAAPRQHANALHPHRVPPDAVDRHPRGDLRIPVVERQAALEKLVDQPLDVRRAVGVAERLVRHVAARRIGHLQVLEMEARGGKVVDGSRVIVMQVGDDDVGDPPRIDAEHRQPLARQTHDLAPATRRLLAVEPGVDHDGALPVDDRPHEIVDRHRRVVTVGRHDEIVGADAPLVPSVADGEQFPGLRIGHALSPSAARGRLTAIRRPLRRCGGRSRSITEPRRRTR